MSDDIQFGRWLSRYGLPDAYTRWRAADATRASDLAFVAIASEDRLLMRLSPSIANSLANQAEEIALNMPSSKEVSQLGVVAARVVAGRIQEWRHYITDKARRQPKEEPRDAKAAEGEGEGEAAVGQPDPPQDILKQAQADFPNSRLSAAGTLLNMSLRMGARGLLQLGEPMDAVLALGAARAAARRFRCHPRSMHLPLERCAEAISILQQWCALSGKNPFILAYGVEGGKLVDRVSGFAIDASTCVDIAAATPGAMAAPGFDALEAAEEFHAYAILSLHPDFVWNMDIDRAQHFASAAARWATTAIADPTTKIPEFPEGYEVSGPKLVLALARAACYSGVQPRRSAHAGGR